MRQIQFDIKTKDELNEYHLGAARNKWLDKTIWTDKQDFYQTLFDKYESQESQFHELFYNLAYYNCTHEENIFVYERLIWDLIAGKKIYAIINFRTASFLVANDLPFEKISWEYEIEYLSNIDFTQMVFTDNEFVRAKTGWIQPPTDRWDNNDEDKTALFEVNDFRTFIGVIFSIIMDDCGSINLFCCEKEKKNFLTDILNGDNKPSLEKILDPNDIFITLFLGSDEGYQDYLLIKTKADLTRKLKEISDKLNKAGQIYEDELDHVNSFDNLVRLIEKSFGLKMHNS